MQFTPTVIDYERRARFTQNRSRFWSWKMRRPYAQAGIVLIVLFLAIFVTVWSLTRPVTRFSPGFNRRAFQSLPHGLPVRDVLKRVGNPLAFSIETTSGSKTVSTSHDFVTAADLLQRCDAGGRVLLFYSWKAKPGRDFEVYIVHLNDGKTVGTGVYNGG